MLYNNHRRSILSSEHSDKKVTEISKMVGEEWRKMTEQQKEPWKDKANNALVQYELEMIKFREQNGITEPKKKKKEKTPKVGEKRSAPKELAQT